MRKSRKIMAGVGIALAGVMALACASGNSTPTHPAQLPGSGTAGAPAAKATPVSLNGHGEGVVQANLVSAGYTLAYTSSGGFIVVTPVNADGSDGLPWVNGANTNLGQSLSGTTVVHSTGPTALHVSNVDGSDWTLTFTPLG